MTAQNVLFLDTNVLLHYPALSSVDWLKVAGLDAIKLHLCITVIHELDDKKSDPLLRQRAESVIDQIEEVLKRDGLVRPGVTLETSAQELPRADPGSGFSEASSDDQILRHAIAYKALNPDASVTVVTEDLGMRLKCEARQMPNLRLDRVLRLETPADAQTKEFRKVRDELTKLKAAMPDVTVLVSRHDDDTDAVQRFEFEVGVEPLTVPVEAALLAKADEECPRLEPTGELLEAAEEFDRYEKEAEQYRERLRQHVKRVKQHNAFMARAFPLTIVVHNRGGAPAQDVDAEVQFPEFVRLLDRTHLPDAVPSMPEPPKRPRSRIELIEENRVSAMGLGLLPRIPLSTPQPPREETKLHVDSAKRRVTVRTTRLRHGYYLRVKLYVVFESPEAIRSFSAPYHIAISNRVEAQNGTLHFYRNEEVAP